MITDKLSHEEQKIYLDLVRQYELGPEVLPAVLQALLNVPSRIAIPAIVRIMNQEGMLSAFANDRIENLLSQFLSPVQVAPVEIASPVYKPKWTIHCGDTLKLKGNTEAACSTIKKFGQFWRVTKGSDSRKAPELKQWFVQSLHWKDQGMKKPAGSQIIEVMWLREQGGPFGPFDIVDIHSMDSGPFNYKDYQ